MDHRGRADDEVSVASVESIDRASDHTEQAEAEITILTSAMPKAPPPSQQDYDPWDTTDFGRRVTWADMANSPPTYAYQTSVPTHSPTSPFSSDANNDSLMQVVPVKRPPSQPPTNMIQAPVTVKAPPPSFNDGAGPWSDMTADREPAGSTSHPNLPNSSNSNSARFPPLRTAWDLFHARGPFHRLTGFVKTWQHEKGFGFITSDEGHDYFVHRIASGDSNDRLAYLTVNAQITFSVDLDTRKDDLAVTRCDGFTHPSKGKGKDKPKGGFFINKGKGDGQGGGDGKGDGKDGKDGMPGKGTPVAPDQAHHGPPHSPTGQSPHAPPISTDATDHTNHPAPSQTPPGPPIHTDINDHSTLPPPKPNPANFIPNHQPPPACVLPAFPPYEANTTGGFFVPDLRGHIDYLARHLNLMVGKTTLMGQEIAHYRLQTDDLTHQVRMLQAQVNQLLELQTGTHGTHSTVQPTALITPASSSNDAPSPLAPSRTPMPQPLQTLPKTSAPSPAQVSESTPLPTPMSSPTPAPPSLQSAAHFLGPYNKITSPAPPAPVSPSFASDPYPEPPSGEPPSVNSLFPMLPVNTTLTEVNPEDNDEDILSAVIGHPEDTPVQE